MMLQVDAIVVAGGTPRPQEPLYAYTQGRPKALLTMGGRPMIQWVVAALDRTPLIRRLVVSGLTRTDVALACSKPLTFAADQGTMLRNIQAGLAQLQQEAEPTPYVLLVSSDIPALTPAAVDWYVTTALQTGHEAYYALIPRDKMEGRFPGSRRSYFYFKDGVYTGSDLNLIAAKLLAEGHPLAEAIIEARKNIFRQAALIGLDALLLFALRRLTVDEAVQIVSRRLKVRGRALICPYAEAGMDVDKPGQYTLMRHDLEATGAQ